MHLRVCLVLLSVSLSAGPEPEPEPEPTPAPLTEMAFSGVVVDRVTGEPLEECLVGTSPGDAAETGEDGRFDLVVDLGATVSVRCEDRPVRSAALPDLALADWVVEIDSDEGPADACSPSVGVDATAVDGIGGTTELRVVNADATASLRGAFYAQQTVGAGVFEVPPGDFKVLARAYGGPEAGFGISDRQTCDGAALPEVAVVMEPVSTRDLGGTWEPTSSDVALSVFATQPLDDSDFSWWEQDVAHDSSGNPVGWSLTVAEGIGTGPLDLEACQARDGELACRGRLDVDEGGAIALGPLVEPVVPLITVDADGVTVSLPFEIGDGRMTVRMDDLTDPLAQRTVWRGVAAGSELTIATEWFEDGLAGTDYGFRVFAIDGAVIDWSTSPEPTDFVDGYAYQAPGLVQVEN